MLWLLLFFSAAPAHEGLHEALVRADARVEAAGDAHALVVRADLHRRAGDPRAALADLEAAERLDPGHRALWLARAEAFFDLGDLPAAERAVDRFLAAGSHAEALALRARVLQGLGRPDEALASWDASLALGPDPDHALARGRLAVATGDPDRAAAGYAALIEALDGAVALRLALVEVERLRGEHAAALAQVDALLAAVPDHADWLVLRAEVVREAGGDPRPDLERALAALDRQIAARPTAARHTARAEVRRALGLPPQETP